MRARSRPGRDEPARIALARQRDRAGRRAVVGGCRVDELAAEYGTPLYVYDAETLRARARAYAEPLSHRRGGGFVAFAVKACGKLG